MHHLRKVAFVFLVSAVGGHLPHASDDWRPPCIGQTCVLMLLLANARVGADRRPYRSRAAAECDLSHADCSQRPAAGRTLRRSFAGDCVDSRCFTGPSRWRSLAARATGGSAAAERAGGGVEARSEALVRGRGEAYMRHVVWGREVVHGSASCAAVAAAAATHALMTRA